MGKLNIDAKKAIAELKLVIAEVENLKKSTSTINQSNKAAFSALDKRILKLRNTVGLLSNKLNHLEAILKKNKTSLDADTRAVDKNTKSRKKQSRETDKASKSTRKNTTANKKNKSSFTGIGAAAGKLLAVFGTLAGIQIFAKLIKNVFELTKTFDGLSFALERIRGDMEGAIDSQAFLLDITTRFGAELVSTTNRWIKFLAAAKQSGLTLKDTEDIFRSMTKAAGVLGLKTDELTGIYLALEQMLSKGKVTTEELRRQLGERLPGAMGIMAASIGVTISALDKMLKKGEILSAEVLPNFAKAVELAYGIETIEKVDTLVAAQNRVTTAWQNFVQTVISDSSLLRQAFDAIAAFIDDVGIAFGGNQAKIVEATRVANLSIVGMYNSHFKELAEQQLGQVGLAEFIQEEKIRLEKELTDATLMEQASRDGISETTRKRVIEEAQSALLKKQIDFEKVKDKIAHDFAEKNLFRVKQDFDEQTMLAEDFQKKLERIAELQAAFPRNSFESLAINVFGDQISEVGEAYGVIIDSQEALDKALGRSNLKLGNAIAMWQFFQKLAETSNVEKFVPEISDKGLLKLRTVRDLLLDIQKLATTEDIIILEGIVGDETLNLDKREQAAQELHEKRIALAKLTATIEIAIIDDKFEAEEKRIKEAIENEKLDRKEGVVFLKELDDEQLQKKQLAAIKHSKILLGIEKKHIDNLRTLKLFDESAELSKVKDVANLKIIALTEEFNTVKTTAERKKEIEEELKTVALDAANAIIDAKIAIIRATIAMMDADDEYMAQLLRDINALEAARPRLKPNEDDAKDWQKFWDEILDMASEFNDAISSIVDGLFGRRIENINAEIEAERDKYDRLIELAEGDDEQQKTLRRNKQRDIELLEKKRLKQEQKQAKARKAFAISDIAIKTAQAIMGIWSDFPKFDFGISATLATVLVSALGAAQIASVLAQPIPKFREGGNITKDIIGIINDGIFQEYIERDGQILTTKKKDAVVPLKSGDTVYKNFDEMVKRSIILNTLTSGKDISKDDFDRYFFGIKGSIKQGFKEAKINNKINISERNNDAYREQMSRWN